MTRWRTPITIAGGILAALAAIAGLSAVAALREWLFLPIVAVALVAIALLARWHRRSFELAASMRRHPSGKAVGRASMPPANEDRRRVGGTR